MSGSDPIVIRHFRQVVLWPLQLVVPERTTSTIQRPWEGLSDVATGNPWSEVLDEFQSNPERFEERHYREFVTFLPYVQRFIYGSKVGLDPARREGEPSLRVYRRQDITGARITYTDDTVITFGVGHVELYFFLDADVVLHAFEIFTDDITLERAQETMFRFGRAYPGFWDENGEGANCPRRVEWLDARGAVRGVSDYAEQRAYLTHVAKHRTARLAAHWATLLEPLLPADSDHVGALRYRPLEHFRMPFLAYLSIDEPTRLSRMDFVRLALAAAPADRDVAPYSEQSLATFEADYCEDRYWGRPRDTVGSDTRILVSGRVLGMLGRHGDAFFCDPETGVLGQFRHQYFLLFLIVHFHRSALLSISDQLAVAMNRLDVGDTESVRQFKRSIRQAMEVFLRFTHRYWYHQISNQDLARSLFQRMRRHLELEVLYEEVRVEMLDMHGYLDSDALRRQANTVLRLTVMTIMAMIGTIATGFIGMNVIAAAGEPLAWRIAFFAAVLLVTGGLTLFTVAKSKRLADFLDALSDERLGWRDKLRALEQRRQ